MSQAGGQRGGNSGSHRGLQPGDAAGGTAESEAADLLWKVIGRFDFYIGSTNAKAALLIAFNTFVTGSIVLKGPEARPLFGDHDVAFALAVVALLAAASASLASMWLTFRVIRPYLESPRSPTQYHSAIFFGHVAEHEQPHRYQAFVTSLDAASRVKDLAAQAHALAIGLKSKSAAMRRAIDVILFVQIPALGLVILLLFGCMAYDVLVRGVAQ